MTERLASMGLAGLVEEIWDEEDWYEEIACPRILAHEPISPEARADWDARLEAARAIIEE